MADKSKRKRGKDGADGMSLKEPASRLQKKVTQWLRKNVPTKKTKFLQAHVVEYFVASKAIDSLLNDSPWSKEKVRDSSKAELVFASREQCVSYMDDLLRHKMFHRAKKIPVADKATKRSKSKKACESENDAATPKPGSGDADGGKAKRRIRLDMHLDQVFVDGNDAYVWIYDPVSWVYWLGGTAIVMLTIAICMFPLWPPMMRTGVHYLSIGAAGFLLLIMAIAALKYVLFAVLFALSGGKLSFWLFPNLTEDVGFLESFLPVYDYTYTGRTFLRKKKKEKDSDSENEDDEKASNDGHSESDESTSKRSSTGKDFELVNQTDTEDGAS